MEKNVFTQPHLSFLYFAQFHIVNNIPTPSFSQVVASLGENNIHKWALKNSKCFSCCYYRCCYFKMQLSHFAKFTL